MEQDTTGIICFQRVSFMAALLGDLLDATVDLALCCFENGTKVVVWFVELICCKEVLQVFFPALYCSVFMVTVADSYN